MLANEPSYRSIKGEGQTISMGGLGVGLDTVIDILFACHDNIGDLIDIHCGNGMYQGHFMLLKLGLEHAMDIINGLRPDTDNETGGDE